MPRPTDPNATLSRAPAILTGLLLLTVPLLGSSLAVGGQGTWEEAARFSSDTASGLGQVVAVEDGLAAVGAPGSDTDVGTKAGIVDIYRLEADGWTGPVTLTPGDADARDEVGSAVDLDGDRLLVGAHRDDTGATDAGSAYLFELGPDGWTETAKLTAADGGEFANLGGSVALDGATALVGAPRADTGTGDDAGAAYVYELTDDGWTQTQKLTAPDGAAGDRLGTAVALHGTTALIGAPRADAVYVFEASSTGWVQTAKLTLGAEAASGGLFGGDVDLDGDLAVVGGILSEPGLVANGGAAFVFERGGDGWTQVANLTGTLEGDQFGASVAVDGDLVLAGAPSGNRGDSSGTALVFTRDGGDWSQVDELTPSRQVSLAGFGFSADLDGTTALVGAPGEMTDAGFGAGAAYLFDTCVDDGPLTGPIHENLEPAGETVGQGAGQTIHDVNCGLLQNLEERVA